MPFQLVLFPALVDRHHNLPLRPPHRRHPKYGFSFAETSQSVLVLVDFAVDVDEQIEQVGAFRLENRIA